MVAEAAKQGSLFHQQHVKDAIAVSMLKKQLEISKDLMQQLLQENLPQKSQPKPPANPQGTISLYA